MFVSRFERLKQFIMWNLDRVPNFETFFQGLCGLRSAEQEPSISRLDTPVRSRGPDPGIEKYFVAFAADRSDEFTC